MAIKMLVLTIHFYFLDLNLLKYLVHRCVLKRIYSFLIKWSTFSDDLNLFLWKRSEIGSLTECIEIERNTSKNGVNYN